MAWYHFDMDIAFYLPGRVPVYTFSLLIAIGVTIGLFLMAKDAPKVALQAHFTAGIWSLLGAAILGRGIYVVIHWNYFQAQPNEIPQIWLGGISGHAAIVGGFISLALFAMITKTHFGALSDALLPLLTTLMISAWLGCWINGCLYGPEVQAWWGVPARDEWGEFAARWPLQLVGASLTLLIAWGVDQIPERNWLSAPGLAAALEVGCIALTLLWAATFRVDPVPQWRNLGLDTWASFGLFILAITGAILILIPYPTTQPTNY